MRRGRVLLLSFALVATLVAPSTTAGAAALKPSSVVLTASSTRVTAGDEVILRAAAPRGRYLRNDPVVLERWSGSTWVKISSARLDAAGRAAVRVRPAAGSSSYRVSKRATRKFRATVSKAVLVRTSRSAAAIRLGVDSLTSQVGVSVSLRADVAIGSFRTDDVVVLQRRLPDGSWTEQARDGLSGRGEVTFSVPTRLGETSYRAVKSQTDLFESATSDRVLLVGQAVTQVSLSADTSTAALGETVRLSGATTPRYSRGAVLLYSRALDGTAALLRETPLSSDGSFDFTVTPEVARHTYFVELDVRTDGQFASGTSAPVVVTVDSAGPGRPPLLRVNGPGRTMTLGGVRPDTTASFVVEPGTEVALGTGRVVGFDGLRPGSIIVRDPAGVPVEARPSSSSDTPSRWTFTPEIGGLYTVEVQAPAPTSGRFDLVVTTPLDLSVQTNGDEVLMSSEGLPGRELQATFTGSPGAYVSLAISTRKDWIDQEARLRDVAAGSTVDKTVSGQGVPIWVLPHGGDYRLEYEPSDARTRSARLGVTSTHAVDSVPINGPTTEVSIDRPGALRVLRVDAPGGVELTAAVTYEDTVSEGVRTDNSRYVLHVLRPDGGATSWTPPDDRVGFGAIDDGPLYLVVQGQGSATPTVRLDVTRAERQDVTPNGPVAAFSSEGRAGQEMQADFDATEGEYISVGQSDVVLGAANEGRVRRPFVGLYDRATNAPVDEIDFSRTWRIPRSGSFRLRVVPNAAFAMSFDVTTSSTRPVPLVPDATAPVLSFEREGEARVFSVEAAEGETIAAAITAPAGSHYAASILGERPDVIVVGSRASWTAGRRPNRIIVHGATRQSGASPARLDVSTPLRRTVVPGAGPVRMSTGPRAGREMDAQFSASAGDWISYAIDEPENWSVERIQLIDLETGRFVPRLEGWSAGDVLDIWEAPRDGTYGFRLVPKLGSVMSADLYVSRTPPTPIDVGGPWQVPRIEKPGDLAVYSFSAAEGRPLVVGMALSAFEKLDGSLDYGRLFITRSPTRPLVRSGTGRATTEETVGFTPDASGTWTVVIAPEMSGSTGGLVMRVRDP